ncbi:MAG: MerC domain-containing protein [Candidatus Omnitrophica bacterium]|nr:MerC domain-containing protein [Candidatus Omnitrophota bacterium]
MTKWIQSLDKFGAVGSVIATLCCLGFAPLVALLSAIGVGFLVKDAVLLPLLIVFLVIGGIGLWSAARRHGKFQAVWLHGISAVALVLSASIIYQRLVVWLSLAGIIGASVWSFAIQQACHAKWSMRRNHGTCKSEGRCR